MIFLNACAYLDTEGKREKNILEQNIDINSVVDTSSIQKASFDRDVSFGGMIEDIKNNKLYILIPDAGTKEVRLKDNTKYLEIYIDKSGLQINSQEITQKDFFQGQTVKIDAYNAGTEDQEDLEALIVKVFITVAE
jgi:hypothetical protein